MTIPCASWAKFINLQSVTTLGSTNWLVETNLVARSGTSVTLTVPPGPAMKFYRVGVSDVDSDGSGLMNDWEKYQLGLDPSNAWSNAQQDMNGNAMSDYTYATNLLASQNVITITATDPTATTEPDPGASPTDLVNVDHHARRFSAWATSVTVNLGLGGPGSGFCRPGVDYICNNAAATYHPDGGKQLTQLFP